MIDELSILIQMNIPTIIWGPPGVGKTSAIYALGRALGKHTEVVIASIHDPSDFSGLPIPEDRRVWYAPPDWAVRLLEAGDGLLFFDEISTAPPSVQAALLRPILEGMVGSLKLPDKVSRVAAANPPEQAAGGWNLTPPLANRFCHLEWTVDSSKWVEGFLGGFPDPKVVKIPDSVGAHVMNARALVASFINARPSALFSFPKDEAAQSRAWPSPRMWDQASKCLGACTSIGADDDLVASLLSGCVGAGATNEFLSWRKALDLPQPEEILANPQGWDIPKRDDQVFAAGTGVIAYICSHLNKTNWEKAWDIIEYIVKNKKPDIAAVLCRQLIRGSQGKDRKQFPFPNKILALKPIFDLVDGV